MNPIDTIQAHYEEFTKTEQDIAVYIINHPQDAARRPITSIAQASGTSKSALIRFSQKIGYKGFSEFRFDLSRFLVGSNGIDITQEEKPTPVTAIADKYCEVIQQLKNAVSCEELNEISQMIINANRIKIVGLDRTFNSASQLRLRISKIGYDAEAVDNIALIQDLPEILKPQDLIILFTIRNNHKNYDDFVTSLHDSGIPVVCITMTPNLKFNKYCDKYIVLPMISKDTNYSFLDNQVIFLVFIEMLLECLAKISV